MLCVKRNLQPKLVLTVVKQLSARVMGTFSCGMTTLVGHLVVVVIKISDYIQFYNLLISY